MSPERFNNDFYPLRDSLYRTAFYILESRDDAMDAVQDIFLKIWQNRDDLDTVHNPKAYCQTLVRNLCLDRLRSKQMRDRADLGELLDERAESQEKTLSEREELRLLSKAIEELPQREKLVITKKVLEGLDYPRIQEQTGIGYLTLRVLLSNARRKLKKYVKKYETY